MNTELCHQILSQLYGPETKYTKAQKCLNFFIIKGKKDMRWLIPCNPDQGYVTLQEWRPYSKISLILWRLFLVLYQHKLLYMLPNVECLEWKIDTKKNASILNQWEQTQLIPVIYLGTPNDTRKAVIMLVDRNRKTVCHILKLALTSGAKTKILHETKILKQLREKTTHKVPHVLYSHPAGIFSIQQALPGKLSTPGFTQQHLQYLLSLKADKTTYLSAYNHDLLLAISRLNNITKNQIIFLHNHVTQIAGSTPIPVVWEHGDFAPWNLKQTSQGLQAFDWEDATECGLPLQDALHFFAIQAYLFGKRNDFIKYFFQSPLITHYYNYLGLSKSTAKFLAKYYLIDMLLKYYEEDKLKHGYFLYNVLKKTNWDKL